jgi:hypothetical protein
VYWGLWFDYELDLLSVSSSNYGTEIEIKISKADLKKDLEKTHKHGDIRIRWLYFAGPEKLLNDMNELVPKNAGIITVSDSYVCKIQRKPKQNKAALPFTKEQIIGLLRLGNMRYWKMLEKYIKTIKRQDEGKFGGIWENGKGKG